MRGAKRRLVKLERIRRKKREPRRWFFLQDDIDRWERGEVESERDAHNRDLYERAKQSKQWVVFPVIVNLPTE